jgi:hypothetical protein
MLVYSDGTLDAQPFTSGDVEWAGDGLEDDAKRGGRRERLLIQPLQRVPPEYWETAFAATPETLIAALAESRWRATILQAWADAAARFGSTRWAAPQRRRQRRRRAAWSAWS